MHLHWCMIKRLNDKQTSKHKSYEFKDACRDENGWGRSKTQLAQSCGPWSSNAKDILLLIDMCERCWSVQVPFVFLCAHSSTSCMENCEETLRAHRSIWLTRCPLRNQALSLWWDLAIFQILQTRHFVFWSISDPCWPTLRQVILIHVTSTRRNFEMPKRMQAMFS